MNSFRFAAGPSIPNGLTKRSPKELQENYNRGLQNAKSQEGLAAQFRLYSNTAKNRDINPYTMANSGNLCGKPVTGIGHDASSYPSYVASAAGRRYTGGLYGSTLHPFGRGAGNPGQPISAPMSRYPTAQNNYGDPQAGFMTLNSPNSASQFLTNFPNYSIKPEHSHSHAPGQATGSASSPWDEFGQRAEINGWTIEDFDGMCKLFSQLTSPSLQHTSRIHATIAESCLMILLYLLISLSLSSYNATRRTRRWKPNEPQGLESRNAKVHICASAIGSYPPAFRPTKSSHTQTLEEIDRRKAPAKEESQN